MSNNVDEAVSLGRLLETDEAVGRGETYVAALRGRYLESLTHD